MPGSPLAAWSRRIERLRAEPADGDMGIGGATLAGEAAQLGLIDEFRPHRSLPVLVGGGIPFYPQCERRLDLELIESRTLVTRGSSTCAIEPDPRAGAPDSRSSADPARPAARPPRPHRRAGSPPERSPARRARGGQRR